MSRSPSATHSTYYRVFAIHPIVYLMLRALGIRDLGSVAHHVVDVLPADALLGGSGGMLMLRTRGLEGDEEDSWVFATQEQSHLSPAP